MGRIDTTRIVRAALFGALAGIINFVIQEPYVRTSELMALQNPRALQVNVFAESARMFAILGMLVSVAIVMADEIGSWSVVRMLTRCGTAITAGGILGGAAGFIGQGVFSALLSPSPAAVIIARTFGWAAVGAGIGLAAGLPSLSLRKCVQGFVGGLVGGGVGGIVFDVVSIPFGAGTVSRLIGDTTIGGAVGTAVMLVEEAAKVAWITVVVGRNEGKQYILSKPVVVIGRDELADIPMFGDLSVAKRHAQITTSDWRRFVLQDLGTQTGTLVNGARITETVLADGDRIQIGTFHLVFNQRVQAPHIPESPVMLSERRSTESFSEAGVCSFCGTIRDPVTGTCSCTPSAAVPTTSKPATARLVGVSGPYSGCAFYLEQDRVEIGRDPSNGIVLDSDPAVSRRHAELVRQGETYIVRDVGSTNGTYVNGVRIQEAVLNPGSVLSFGNSSFRFER
jgi:pSer/pThr/pTyr-binding forkhead associated (FHA) protein